MPDTKLADALRAAKSKPMFFAWILKGGGDGRLLVSKSKISMDDALAVKKEIGGDKPLTGQCSGPLDNLVFKTGGVWPGVTENVIKKVVKRDAGLSIEVTFLLMGHDKELINDDVAMGKADAKIPPPLPLPKVNMSPGEELDRLMMIAEIVDSITPMKGDFSDGAHYNITMNGKQYEINQKEADTNRKNLRDSYLKGAQKVQQLASNTEDEYKIYRKTMTTGWFGTVATFVFDHVSVTDPGMKVAVLVAVSNTSAKQAISLANQNSFVKAAKALVDGDKAAQTAHHLIMAYKNGIESSAASTVTVLEGVKTASEITLAVGGAVVTGGGTIGLVGGMGIKAASDLSPALFGEKIDWLKFTVDMATAVVFKKLGPGKAIEGAILTELGPTAIEKVGEKAAKEAIAKVIGATSEALMKTSVEATRKNLSGDKNVTWDEFGESAKKDLYKKYTVEVLKLLMKK